MTREEFLEEVLRSEYCPKHFVKIYAQINEWQDLLIEILKEFHRICEKNKISYQLAYGSLLGAVRDGGMIPWDFDADVWVAYDDKKRLIKALKKDLKERFFFDCLETNAKCEHALLRIVPKGYDTAGVALDVFYIIGMPSDVKERKKYAKRIKKIDEVRRYKVFPIKRSLLFSNNIILIVKSIIKVMLKKLQYAMYSMEQLNTELDILLRKYPVNQSIMCTVLGETLGEHEILYKYFCNTELIQMESKAFKVSAHYDELLKIHYGKYTEIAPLKDRLAEMMTQYGCWVRSNNAQMRCTMLGMRKL